MDRSYAVLEIKSVDAGARTFSGMATTPHVDRGGDRVDPFGVRANPRIPLFLFHDRTRPVGFATFGQATAAGVPFTATIPEFPDPGVVRDRLEEAWHLVKSGLVTAVSIGWKALAGGVQWVNGIRELKNIEVHELSIESLPMNPNAIIHTIKTLRAAAGAHAPGVSGTSEHGAYMTIAETIQDWTDKREAADARIQAILTASGGNVLETKTGAEYDGLTANVAEIDVHLERLRAAERANLAAAARVETGGVTGTKTGSLARAGLSVVPRITVRPNLPPGQMFVRRAMALLAGKNSRSDAIRIAEERWPDLPEIALSLKAAVPPANTTDGLYAGPLVGMSKDFIPLLRASSVVGKIPDLRDVPFDIPVPIQTLGGVYNWTGQGKLKPVTKLGFSSGALTRTKITGILVMTEELARSSSPKAEEIFRNDMIAGIGAFKDSQFLDPANAPVAAVNPGSITNGIAGTAATADPAHDLGLLLGQFAANNVPLSSVTVVMSEGNAFNLALFKTIGGEPMFSGIGVGGGSIAGVRVIASNAAGANVIALSGPLIMYADDGEIEIDVSREASVAMDSAPMDPPDATIVLTSLWQNNLIGLRADLFVNWKRSLNAGVHYLTGAAWAPTA